MKNIYNAAAILLAANALGGCATVINGTSQDYKIKSEPTGAKVHLTNGEQCTTPCELKLKRKHDQRVDLTLDGYKPAYVLVQSRMGGATAGNILLGGLIGGVVDGTNGASNHLKPDPLHVRMVKTDSTEEAMLLDKKGKNETTVAKHNDSVRADLSRTLGPGAAGVQPATEAAASATAVTTPAAVDPAAPAATPVAPAAAVPAATDPTAAAPTPVVTPAPAPATP